MKGITIYNIFSILLLAIPWSIGAAFIIYLLFTKYMYWLLGYVWYEWTIEWRKDMIHYLFREEIALRERKEKTELEMENKSAEKLCGYIFGWAMILVALCLIILTYKYL